MDINKLVSSEVAWLAKQEGKVFHDLMDVYEGTLDEIGGTLRGLKKDSYSSNHARAIQGQLETLVNSMGDRQSQILGKSLKRTFTRNMKREGKTLALLEKAFGEPEIAQQFSRFTPKVPQKTIKKLLLTQDISIKGLSAQAVKDVRKLGVARSLVRGEGTRETVKRLDTMGVPLREGRLHLIARMETARAGNEAKVETLTQVSQAFPQLDIWQMVKDSVDKGASTRNHWLSWTLSGTVRNVSEKEWFEVWFSTISATRQLYASITNKTPSDSGILMDAFDKGLRTKSIPAHFHDRAVLLAWRPKWGAQFGPVKHPQGPISGVRRSDAPKDIEQKPSSKAPPLSHSDSQGKGKNQFRGRKLVSPELVEKFEPYRREYYGLMDRVKAEGWSKDTAKEFYRQHERAHKTLFSLNPGKASIDVRYELHSKSLVTEDLKKKHQVKHVKDLPAEVRPIKADFIKKLKAEDNARKGVLFVNRLLGKNAMRGNKIQFRYHDSQDFRPEYSFVRKDIHINVTEDKRTDVKNVVHELGHWIEDDPKVLKMVQTFWEERTGNEKYVSMLDVAGKPYTKDEKTKVDDFLDPYMGIGYWNQGNQNGNHTKRHDLPGRPDKMYGSEVVSRSLDLLYENPLQLIYEDSHHFDFLWKVIKHASS